MGVLFALSFSGVPRDATKATYHEMGRTPILQSNRRCTASITEKLQDRACQAGGELESHEVRSDLKGEWSGSAHTEKARAQPVEGEGTRAYFSRNARRF